MIISNKKKFLFIAIPKTGTTSLSTIFGKIKGSECYNKVRPLPEGEKYWKHMTLSEVYLFNQKIKNYFKFCFIRNPYDYALSWIKYEHQKKRINLPENASFKDLLNNAPPRIWKNQIEWLLSHDVSMNFVGKFENLQEDFNIVCDKIGIPQQQLPHANKTKHKHYTEYYDNETREIVAEKYAKDIEYFGYKFDQ